PTPVRDVPLPPLTPWKKGALLSLLVIRLRWGRSRLRGGTGRFDGLLRRTILHLARRIIVRFSGALNFAGHLVGGLLELFNALAEALRQLRQFLGAKENEDNGED